jgi:hypothetical protein
LIISTDNIVAHNLIGNNSQRESRGIQCVAILSRADYLYWGVGWHPALIGLCSKLSLIVSRVQVPGAQQNVACDTFAIAALHKIAAPLKLKFHLKQMVLENSFALYLSWRAMTLGGCGRSEGGTRGACEQLRLFSHRQSTLFPSASFDLTDCALVSFLPNRLSS